MQSKITSLANPKIKFIVKLRNRNARDDNGLTVVEGYKEILMAINAGHRIDSLYICPEILSKYDKDDILDKIDKNVLVYELAVDVFDKVSFGNRNEGVIGLFELNQTSFESINIRDRMFCLVVDQIEKPGNLGGILRTCDAVGIDAVFVSDPRVDVYSPNVIRNSLGAVFSVKIVADTKENILSFLKDNNILTVSAVVGASQNYFDVNLAQSIAVVVGSEDKGLQDFWMKNADSKIAIPMCGEMDSLNVSVSTAVILYEAFRQRQRNAAIT